jgi:ABC-type sugar transport system ATPase subunit|tara:strand:- start:2620 stop:3669 length:1050 start_codon:yes stop_codon:yes gene_type:complete
MPSSLKLEKISKRFEIEYVLKDFNLDIAEGEFVAILGPSGCGKTTLLRIICGLEEPTIGKVFLDNHDITNDEPKERNIALVFQNYALYPHKSVYDNLSLNLKFSGFSKDVIQTKVNFIAKMLNIEGLLDRRPKSLSGGENQRVALGRAIIRNPKIFLFDEPLSNLDADLRIKMREELRSLHKELNTTMVYVTHDQIEAMSLGQKIVILKSGVIQQVGTPESIYNEPANRFVAEFIGYPKMNFFSPQIQDGKMSIGGQMINYPSTISIPKVDFQLGIRPRDIHISDGSISLEINSFDYQGNSWLINCSIGDHKIILQTTHSEHDQENINIDFDWDKVFFFDKNDGTLIKQ